MTTDNSGFETQDPADGVHKPNTWVVTVVSTAEKYAEFLRNPSTPNDSTGQETFEFGWVSGSDQSFKNGFEGLTLDLTQAIFDGSSSETVENFENLWGSNFIPDSPPLDPANFDQETLAESFEDFDDAWGVTSFGDTIALVGGTTYSLTDSQAPFREWMVGQTLEITGAASSGNNGAFTITQVISTSVVQYSNPAAVAEGYAGRFSVYSLNQLVTVPGTLFASFDTSAESFEDFEEDWGGDFEFTIPSTSDASFSADTSSNTFESFEEVRADLDNVTVDEPSDTITRVGHSLSDGDVITFRNEGGSLPGGILADTVYYVRNSTANTLQISSQPASAIIDIVDAGTGSHFIKHDTSRFWTEILVGV
jgi:hypothetical protein